LAKNQNGYDADQTHDIEDPDNQTIGGDSELRSLLSKEYEACQRSIKYFALDWDEYEDLLMVQSRTADNLHVRVSEGSLSTIVIERAARVMAQMPTGVVHALGIKNTGQSLLYNLLLTNWIYPNANEQYDLETKLFLWDLYSNVYGTFPMMYDWAFRDDYNGPDCWLVPMRNFWPQQGRFSMANSDYLYVSTFLSRDKLQELVDNNVDTYDLDCINDVLQQTSGHAIVPRSESDYLRHNPMWQYRRRSNYYDTGQFEIVTKYEAGQDARWISFFADYESKVMRNIDSQSNNKIPIALKYALPTLDSIVGLGDMEKGKYMQYAMDNVLNMQIDYQKIHTYPPLKVIMQNVVMPSIRFQPAAKWGVSSMNDIGHHQLPEADQSHNQTYNFLKAALGNVSGDTQTPVSNNQQSVTPGKSPQAIKANQQDESTRDALDLKFMQKATEELFQGMLGLVCTRASDTDAEPIELDLFDDEIKQLLQAGYDDIKDIVKYEGKNKGTAVEDAASVYLKITPDKLQNSRGLRYKIDEGSSLGQDQEAQHTQLNEIMDTYVENAASIEALLNAGGQTIDFPELFKQWFISGGLKQWNNILKPIAQGTQPGQPGATQGGTQQQAQQSKPPSVTLQGKMGPTATAGAEQMVGLPPDPMQPQQTQQSMAQPQQVAQSPTTQAPQQQQSAPGQPQDQDIQAAMQQLLGAAQGGQTPQQPSQPQQQVQPYQPGQFIQDPEIRQAHAQVNGGR
jgi:hypothetical protein